MFTVPEDQFVSRWTIFNHMPVASLRGAATTGALFGGGYGGLIALALAGPFAALIGGLVGGMIGCALGVALGLVNGLACVVVTIVSARPLRNALQYQRAIYGISSFNFGVLTLLGLNFLSVSDIFGTINSSAHFILFI